jgi:uncharacterized protein YecE (DUF72 family)
LSKPVFVGVSGFSYASWKGHFYPKEAKNEDFLSYYSKLLNSVEINSSFYAPPTSAMIKSWSGKAGDGFRFAFKAPRQITHILQLKEGSPESADRLSKTLDPLGQKRGPILFQLPPYLQRDEHALENFLEKTSTIPDRVFEFRHKSWLDESTYSLLERYKAAFCVAETEDLDPVFQVTDGLAYFRLRKDAYDAEAIVNWSEKIGKLARDAASAYVYLRHDETGENAGLALKLLELLKSI